MNVGRPSSLPRDRVAPPRSDHPRATRRPGTITFLGVAQLASAALGSGSILGVMLSPSIRAQAIASTPLSEIPYGFEAGVAVGVILVAVGLPAGWGCLRGRAWAWPLSLVHLGASLAVSILSLGLAYAMPPADASPLTLYGGLYASVAGYAFLLIILLMPGPRRHLARR